MKITACINLLTPQYSAKDALVFPVEAHAARLAPVICACVNAAVIPLSLKLPEGFIPSYCKYKFLGCKPTYRATPSDGCSSVCPSPIVTILFGGANGNRSENRHTPLKHRGSCRRDHFASNASSDRGTRSESQS